MKNHNKLYIMGVSLNGCNDFCQHCFTEPKAAIIAEDISQVVDLLILLF